MKQILLSLFVIAVVVFLGCAPQAENLEQLLADAKALDQQFIEAYNNGDVDGVMATYWNSPDLVSFPPGRMEVRGWKAKKEAQTEELAQMKGATLEFLKSDNKVVGSVVLGSGTWRFTTPMPDGESIIVEGRYTDVKTRIDGKLVYIMAHASVPLPPQPDSPEM